MPVLQSLPIELLRQILSCLNPRALCQVSLVSRLFNSLAESFLYTSLGGYPGWLLPRLCAILSRPDQVRHVHRIEFGCWVERPPTPDNRILFSTKAKELGIPDIGWSYDAQALFLLQILPDVRELSLDHTPLLRRFIENTITTPIENLPFKSLVKFECCEYSQRSSVTLSMLLALMRIPSLREITADMEGSDRYTHDPSVVDSIIAFAGLSRITHLSLHYGNTTTSMLTHILRMPQALTHFSYTDDEQYSYVSDTTPFQTALRVVRPTLQSLFIDKLLALQLRKPDTQTIGVLRDWPALTSIKCSLPALIGLGPESTTRLVDVLPMGIRVLAIRRKDEKRWLFKYGGQRTVEEMTDQLVEVLQTRALEKLTVDTGMGFYKQYHGWLNAYETEVMQRLTVAALGSDHSYRCRIVCF